jgi:hypothetical protein
LKTSKKINYREVAYEVILNKIKNKIVACNRTKHINKKKKKKRKKKHNQLKARTTNKKLIKYCN